MKETNELIISRQRQGTSDTDKMTNLRNGIGGRFTNHVKGLQLEAVDGSSLRTVHVVAESENYL